MFSTITYLSLKEQNCLLIMSQTISSDAISAVVCAAKAGKNYSIDVMKFQSM